MLNGLCLGCRSPFLIYSVIVNGAPNGFTAEPYDIAERAENVLKYYEQAKQL